MNDAQLTMMRIRERICQHIWQWIFDATHQVHTANSAFLDAIDTMNGRRWRQ